ncbi:MAG: hypothetical protein LUQ07_02720, partial [Methanospirillum sp.]|nr:hypothetical protein [Methanospirillum sp.]
MNTYAHSREYPGSPSGRESMVSARCCPADCALREDWENELNQVKAALEDESVQRMERILKAISHPLRLKILLILSNRDQCVC